MVPPKTRRITPFLTIPEGMARLFFVFLGGARRPRALVPARLPEQRLPDRIVAALRRLGRDRTADPPSAATSHATSLRGLAWQARVHARPERCANASGSKIGSPHLGAREISPRFGLAALFFAETKILAHLVGIRSQPQCFGKICAGLRVAAMITEKHTKLERNFWTIGQQASSCL